MTLFVGRSAAAAIAQRAPLGARLERLWRDLPCWAAFCLVVNSEIWRAAFGAERAPLKERLGLTLLQ